MEVSKNAIGDEVEYILIDSPITPYSSEADILKWIKKLEGYPNKERTEVQEEIEIAKNILNGNKNEQQF